MVSGQLQMEMLAGRYTTWIQPIKPLGFSEGVFRLAVKNTYASEWVTNYMGKRIQGLLEGIYNRPVVLRTVVREEAASSPAADVQEATAHVRGGTPAHTGESAPSSGKEYLDSGRCVWRRDGANRKNWPERAQNDPPSRG